MYILHSNMRKTEAWILISFYCSQYTLSHEFPCPQTIERTNLPVKETSICVLYAILGKVKFRRWFLVPWTIFIVLIVESGSGVHTRSYWGLLAFFKTQWQYHLCHLVFKCSIGNCYESQRISKNYVNFSSTLLIPHLRIALTPPLLV